MYGPFEIAFMYTSFCIYTYFGVDPIAKYWKRYQFDLEVAVGILIKKKKLSYIVIFILHYFVILLTTFLVKRWQNNKLNDLS